MAKRKEACCVKKLGKQAAKASKTLGGAGKAIIAGASGAALMASNIGRTVKQSVAEKHIVPLNQKKKKEVIEMKKSTFVGVLVFLAAVAGALGALYVYVVRRERELDEYERLLFSEDFDDEFPEDEVFDFDDEEEAEEDVKEEKAK